MIYAPYFYDLGSGDETVWENDKPIEYFIITDNDRDLFPEIEKDDYAMAVYENDQGFVYCTAITREDFERNMIDAGTWNND